MSHLRPYQIIKSLQYFYNYAKVYISYLCLICPNTTYWKLLDRVLPNIMITIFFWLYCRIFSSVLEGYNDASWICKKSGCNDVTWYLYTLMGGTKSLKYNRHMKITRSTFETELHVLHVTSMKADWLYEFISLM